MCFLWRGSFYLKLAVYQLILGDLGADSWVIRKSKRPSLQEWKRSSFFILVNFLMACKIKFSVNYVNVVRSITVCHSLVFFLNFLDSTCKLHLIKLMFYSCQNNAHEVLEFYIIVYLSFKWQVSFAHECYNVKYEWTSRQFYCLKCNSSTVNLSKQE